MQEKKSLVSIIIPLYNAVNYIAETIHSALNQTWPNVEIIVVDDGSTDNSLAAVKRFENTNIKVLQQKNKGASAARNCGLQEAKGQYIQFLDADDLLDQYKIERQVQAIKNSDQVSIGPTLHFFNEPGELNLSSYESSFYKSSSNPIAFLLDLYGRDGQGGMIPLHAYLTPKSVIEKAGKWNEQLTVNDDGEFFCRVILASSGIVFIENAKSYYRKFSQPKSLSSKKDESSLRSLFDSITLIDKHLSKHSADPVVKKIIARILMDVQIFAYPLYKDLSKRISRYIKRLGGTDYVPVMGGKTIEQIKNMFGWKVARLLQAYKNN